VSENDRRAMIVPAQKGPRGPAWVGVSPRGSWFHQRREKMTKKSSKGGRGRKRRVEDPDDQTEVRTAAPSVVTMTKEERDKKKKRIAHFIAQRKGEKGKMETLRGQMRNTVKAMISEGISCETIDYCINFERGDSAEMRSSDEERALGLEVIGAPYQLMLIDVAYGDPIEQAKAEAKQHAEAGRPPDCRWPEGHDAHDAYMDAYHEIQAGRVPGADKLTKGEQREAAGLN